MYVWERPTWPEFTWDDRALLPLLSQVCRDQGRLLGRMSAVGFSLQDEAHLRTTVEDVVKSSAIEGERLDVEQVRSSVARRLGLDRGRVVAADRHVDGVVEMMLDATGNHHRPLTAERLFAWHAALFPTGRTGMTRIRVGGWRDDRRGPMQVVSGPIGRERVHYQAPPAERVADEMDRFLRWFERPGQADPVLASGLAHLWFVTIHPFDDGNGRIARAISDMALARAEGSSRRFYSLSAQIERERNDYYGNLEWTQKGDVDVTRWLTWFLLCLGRAIANADTLLDSVLRKARFWERFAEDALNPRQIKVINRALDGLDGKLTSSRWSRLAKCSQGTAIRDINDLVARGALRKDSGGGRSTSYSLTRDLVAERR